MISVILSCEASRGLAHSELLLPCSRPDPAKFCPCPAQGRIRTPPPRRRHDVAKLLECASPPRPAIAQRRRLALWLGREERKDGLLCVDRKAAEGCRTPRRCRVLGHGTTWHFRRGHFQDAPLVSRRTALRLPALQVCVETSDVSRKSLVCCRSSFGPPASLLAPHRPMKGMLVARA